MAEIYSDSNDCYELCYYLKGTLKNKLCIYGSPSNPLVSGKYYGFADNTNTGDYLTIKDGLPFYAKFNKEGFLRIGIGSPLSREVTEGEKLAALSDICGVLAEKYGTPDVFYTTKDDDEKLLSLQWTFKDLEVEHERMEYDCYFDDAHIEKLIFMDTTQKIDEDDFTKFVGLPREMYGLVLENLDDFQAAKHGYIREKGKGYVKKID